MQIWGEQLFIVGKKTAVVYLVYQTQEVIVALVEIKSGQLLLIPAIKAESGTHRIGSICRLRENAERGIGFKAAGISGNPTRASPPPCLRPSGHTHYRN